MISAGQRGHGTRGALDHVAHDLLKAVGDAVELVLQRGREAHVSADQVAVPANPDADALHVAGPTHRHRSATANAVEHVVTDDAAAHARAIAVETGLGPGSAGNGRHGAHKGDVQGMLPGTACQEGEGRFHRGHLT
jgi:hypothetical protein